MSLNYPGGLITANPITPAGPYDNGAASGIWTLDQAQFWLKQGLWPIAGNVAPTPALWAARGTNSGGTSNLAISSANLTTTGNWTFWGNLEVARIYGGVGLASTTRGIFAGGYGVDSYMTQIGYVTFGTSGNAVSFGTLSAATGSSNGVGGVSSPTRGVIMGGASATQSGRTDVMSYITTATTGNTTSFGSLSQQVDNLNAGGSSGTRGMVAGGYGNSTGTSARIEYITIASTGNATSFGNLTTGRFIPGGMSNNTRAVWAGGSSTTTIDYVTMASTGNATSFGTLTFNAGDASAVNNGIRGCVGYSGGQNTDYITIATTGNGTSFGSLTLHAAGGMLMGCCGAQGGLT